MPASGEKQENLPMRRPSMRKMVAKHVSTLVKRKHAGASKDDKEDARSRRPEIPPLSFDGAGDEPDLDNSCWTASMVTSYTNTSVRPYSHMMDNNGPVATIDTVHHLHSIDVNRTSPSFRPPIHLPLTAPMSSSTSSTGFSKSSLPQHSATSTAPSSSNRSTPLRMHDFRSTTRELMNQETSPTISSGVQRTLDPLDPAKFDPVRYGTSRQPADVYAPHCFCHSQTRSIRSGLLTN